MPPANDITQKVFTNWEKNDMIKIEFKKIRCWKIRSNGDS